MTNKEKALLTYKKLMERKKKREKLKEREFIGRMAQSRDTYIKNRKGHFK